MCAAPARISLSTSIAPIGCCVAAVPTYVGGLMAMGFVSDAKRLRRASARTIAERYRGAGRFITRYWTPQLRVGAFALPRFIAELTAGNGARR